MPDTDPDTTPPWKRRPRLRRKPRGQRKADAAARRGGYIRREEARALGPHAEMSVAFDQLRAMCALLPDGLRQDVQRQVIRTVDELRREALLQRSAT